MRAPARLTGASPADYAPSIMRITRNMEEAPPASSDGCDDVRCGCGSLLARVVEGAVELKCRRCKRVWRLPVQGDLRVLGPSSRVDSR